MSNDTVLLPQEASADFQQAGVAPRKAWATPKVITGTLDDTEGAPAGTPDVATHS